MTTKEKEDMFAKHRVDLEAVESGKWVEIGDDAFRVASYSAKAVAKERAAAMAFLGFAPDAEVPAAKSEFLQQWIFSRAVLTGMKLKEHPGVSYTYAAGETIFSDPELVHLRNEIQRAAFGDFRKVEVAKAALLGNS